MGILNVSSDYELTKSKSVYPVSLLEAKRHIRLDADFIDDDDYIESLIEVATAMAENYINKDIAKTTNTLEIYDFDTDSVTIYEGNFISVIDVVDANDASIGTVDATYSYFNSFKIDWTNNLSSDPLKITFYTGYNENEAPKIIKQAILIKIADLYDSARSDYNWNGMQDNKVFESILNYYIAQRF
jgi:hypothetical protein